MNKNAIKKFAVWAQEELNRRVEQKMEQYDIRPDADPSVDVVNGNVLSETEKRQRASLIARVQKKGVKDVVEEAAYTWFNRFIALRFMEVNGYLPSMVRVFTDEKGDFHPEILSEALYLDLRGLKKERIYAYQDDHDDEGLYRYLLIAQCNALSDVLPGMFQKLDDETELLCPDHLLREQSVIGRMVADIPAEDWQDQVQIIGWLYQYYNSELKAQVYADKNSKFTKDKIPAATQLFTPDWIVRYMVENSLGRLWLSGHPDGASLKEKWTYYLDDAKQDEKVEEQLKSIRAEYAGLTPEDIRCIDPCVGSGHILCYLFDVLMQIYLSYGYTAQDAARCIVTKNLYGLDIDRRAAQLAYFAVMMKGVQYDSRFLSRGIKPHVYTIRDSAFIDSGLLHSFAPAKSKLREDLSRLAELMKDAKEFGSLITIPEDIDLPALLARAGELAASTDIYAYRAGTELVPFLQAASVLAGQYSVCVTNPPYMSSGHMDGVMSAFVKKYYPDGKADLFAAFMNRCASFCSADGFVAMITQQSWMFLSSFEKLRKEVLQHTIVNMAQLGARAFGDIGGEVVQPTAFVLSPRVLPGFRGTYLRLTEPNSEEGKEELFRSGEQRFIMDAANFGKIPGSPVAYWASNAVFRVYQNKPLSDYAFVGIGMRTGDNNRFLRLWPEVDWTKIKLGATNAIEAEKSKRKWFPYNKGGAIRKWYGNNEFVVNWEDNGREIKNETRRKYPQLGDNLGWKISNEKYYFLPILTWSFISSVGFGGVRYKPNGFISDVAGSMVVLAPNIHWEYYAALLCSNVTSYLLGLSNPTLNMQVKDIANIPVVNGDEYLQIIINIVHQNYQQSNNDWDSFETSWDFQQSPLLPAEKAEGRSAARLSDAWESWKTRANAAFAEMKKNEEELNRIFIDIYGLQDELTPEESSKDVTIHYLADTKDDAPADMAGSAYLLTKEDAVKQFISYCVGLLFGRYSLDVPGLAYAGGDWDASKYKTFQPDADGIIPISDDEYFPDDMVARFVKLVEVIYGKDTLEENLKFIAAALGGKGTARDVIRKYFLTDFYKDHCRMYQKRPIYWLFDSGKKNGFKCLIYMHRYQPDTLARIRTDYVHEQQARYRTLLDNVARQIEKAKDEPTAKRVRLEKEQGRLRDQAEETRRYEEKIHHLADQMIPIDLDDGVKVNYAKFQEVLAKIK